MLRMRVLLTPMYSTVPVSVSTFSRSPMTNGLSIAIDIEGQQITEHRLHGQRDRDAADTEAREQRLDGDPHVVEGEQQGQCPDDRAGDEQEDLHRAGQ